MNRQSLLSALTMLLALLLASCSGPGGGTARPPAQDQVVAQPTSTAQPPIVAPTTTVGRVSTANRAALDFWSSAAGFYMGATEAERFGSLDDIARDSSVAVLARVVSPGPSRVIAGDEGTEDVLVYESVIVEILDVMSGHMSEAHQIGDLLVLEQVGTPPEDAIGTTAVLFLRDKQDMFGFPSDAEPRPEEEGLYRLVSSQGVFIDRGDGVAVNPIIEMVRFMRSGEPGTFTDFVFDDSISINQDTYPVAAVARQMTLTELIDLIASMGE